MTGIVSPYHGMDSSTDSLMDEQLDKWMDRHMNYKDRNKPSKISNITENL